MLPTTSLHRASADLTIHKPLRNPLTFANITLSRDLDCEHRLLFKKHQNIHRKPLCLVAGPSKSRIPQTMSGGYGPGQPSTVSLGNQVPQSTGLIYPNVPGQAFVFRSPISEELSKWVKSFDGGFFSLLGQLIGYKLLEWFDGWCEKLKKEYPGLVKWLVIIGGALGLGGAGIWHVHNHRTSITTWLMSYAMSRVKILEYDNSLQMDLKTWIGDEATILWKDKYLTAQSKAPHLGSNQEYGEDSISNSDILFQGTSSWIPFWANGRLFVYREETSKRLILVMPATRDTMHVMIAAATTARNASRDAKTRTANNSTLPTIASNMKCRCDVLVALLSQSQTS